MRVRTDFTSVNLKTGERTRHIVGDGQRIEETFGIEGLQPLNAEQRRAMEEFGRMMEDEVIPEIVRTMRRRAELAQASRHWIL